MAHIVRKHPTLVARSYPRLVLAAVVVGALLVHASAAHAAADPEQKCQQGRYKAAAKHSACQQKALARLFGGAPFDGKFEAALSKCRVKYTAVWAKLQAKASGTAATCDNARFDTTSTPGTVIDRLTGLQWEQKTDDSTVNDKDNPYSWSAGGGGFTAADGTAFTSFLTTLNGGGCFAGQCDWRLPTISELQTILLEPYPCTTSPCIDQAVFGPTVASLYWSATTPAGNPGIAWYVSLDTGYVGVAYKDNNGYVRAVRAGL